MATYYVSSVSGNDNNDGLTEATAWKSLAKIKTFPFIGGDKVKFKRGETFYGRLTFDAPTFTSRVSVSSYGFGNKPIISGYKVANNASSWVQHSTNVWKIDLTANGTYTGNRDTADTNVGFLNLDEVIRGDKKKTLAEVKSQWQFYSDSTYLYVYSTANPTTLVSNIEIAINITIINKRNYITVRDLEIKGTGGHCVGNAGDNVEILNCRIHAAGGSFLPGYGDGTVRFGNGIEFFNSGNNVLIEHNEIYDVYDVGFTMQGATGWSNVIVRDNIFWKCTQTFEIWASVNTANFVNCQFKDNISINAGYSWAYEFRPDKDTDVDLLLYNIVSDTVDIELSGNIFYNPRGALYYGSANRGYTIPYKSDNNKIFLRKGQKIHKNYNFTVEQSKEFSAQLGKEAHSEFYVLEDAPKNIKEIISSLSTHVGVASGQIKSLQRSLGNAKSSISELSTLIPPSRSANETVEFKHLNGFIKPTGGYVTSSSATVDTTRYAPLAKVSIKSSSNARFDMMMAYMIGADGFLNRNGIGVVNLQIVPATNLAVGTQVDLDVVEFLEFGTITGMTSNDFVAVVEKEGSGEVLVGLYFNIGKDNWSRLSFQPITIFTTGVEGTDSFEFYTKAPLVGLPAGTQKRPSSENPYVKRPTTGTAAPTTTPSYVGQRYLDTTNKKSYEAFGTTSSADWVLLN
jgi:hypothetical protein